MIQLSVLLISIQWLCGCSFMCLGIGAAMDGGTADTDTLLAEVTKNLRPGDEVRIFRNDSTVLEGTYIGPTLLDSAEYTRKNALGQLFRNESLVMKANADTVQVPVNDIKYVERRNSKNAAAIGFGIGVAVDAAFLISTAIAMKGFSLGGH